MTGCSSVLCPIDFSQASRGSLRYGAAIAEHCNARLTLLTVNDALLADMAEVRMGEGWLPADSQRELEQFFAQTFEEGAPGVKPAFEVVSGKPASEILRVAREGRHDLVVMSSRGLTGIRKLFFGATTERVLRETSVPVLVTPPNDFGPADVGQLKRGIRRLLVPVESASALGPQLEVAARVARTMDVPLLLVHVVEPLRAQTRALHGLPNIDSERRDRARRMLERLLSTLPAGLKYEALASFGDPAEEIANVAHDRHVGLVVMGLHASPLMGSRMGSVTYRVLCLASTPILALPPPASVDNSGCFRCHDDTHLVKGDAEKKVRQDCNLCHVELTP